jgi:prephenate dehydrogenase
MAGVFEKVAILGPGLLGGSVGLAIQARGLGEVVFWGRSEERLQAVRTAGFKAETDLENAVTGADLVILATPVGFFCDLARRLAEVGGDFVVTDVGSVKEQVHIGAGAILEEADIEFVGGHPMAGSERCGFSEARADLMEGASCMITDAGQACETTVTRVAAFWESLGCGIRHILPREHDEVVARISHLPHALAAVAARVGLRNPEEGVLSGGGLRDTTRVAGGDPAMWAGILQENRVAVLTELKRASDELKQLQDLVESEESGPLERWLEEGKSAREALSE